jgi:hypothetical protein
MYEKYNKDYSMPVSNLSILIHKNYKLKGVWINKKQSITEITGQVNMPDFTQKSRR